MIETSELPCSCDMGMRVNSAHATKYIRKLLVFKLAIFILINEVVDVKDLIFSDVDIRILQVSHELLYRDEAISVLISQP